MSGRGAITRRAARAITSLVYREIDIRVDPAFDPSAPTVMVSNHFGGLADGLLLIDALPRMPRIVAKDVIFSVPLLGSAASAAGGIPVHQGRPGRRASNDEMFASCYRALRESEIILIFPEGVTQDVPHIAEVKSGAARIALGARASGVAGIRIVPVGIHYEDKAGFRQRVLVNIGQSIDVDRWAAGSGAGPDDRAAAAGLTDLITSLLRLVSPDFPDWPTAKRYAAAAQVVLNDTVEPGTVLRYGDVALLADLLHRRDADGSLERTTATYLRDLHDSRTSEESFAGRADGHRRGDSQLRVRDLLLSLLLLPYAIVGAALGAVPWLLVRALRLAPLSAGVLATLTPVAATFVFGLEWILVSWWAFSRQGTEFGFASVMLAPVFVGATVFVLERLTLLARRFRGRATLNAARRERLGQRREAVASAAWEAL